MFRKIKIYKKRILWTWASFLFVGVLLLCIAELWCSSAGNRIYEKPEQATDGHVILVLGCNPFAESGRVNLFYKKRIDAALELWHHSNASCIIVSGDNSTEHYHEPEHMRQSLIDGGVPSEFIQMDHAGFRTLDSVVRAKEVFGATEITVVSQEWHAERALVLASGFGVNAHAYAAGDVGGRSGFAVRLREVGARSKMLMDIATRKKPKYLGEAIALPQASF